MTWLLSVSLLLMTCVHSVNAGCVKYSQRQSVYYTRCGVLWLFRCTKSRYHLERTCCDNWTGLPFCNKAKCFGSWGTCPNSGTCIRPDYCACDDNHYSPKCDHCTSIANCLNNQYHCTTSSDQTCKKCEHQYGGAINAYLPKPSGGRNNRICEKQCSWRADSLQCYPGKCSGSTATCACAPNFGGPDCMSISSKPDIMHCSGRVSMIEGETEKEYIEADCHNTAASTVYTNIKANRIMVDWTTRYLGPTQSTYPRPYYISGYVVGVTSMQVDWSLTFPKGTSVRTGIISCAGSLSRNNPGTALHECHNGEVIDATITHGQVLNFHVKSQNGGYFSTYDYDTGSRRPGRKEYYSGSWQDHQASFTFDFVDPAHCAPSSGCTDNMLDRGPAYTKQGSFKVKWAGWTDDLSGIKQYEIKVYKLIAYGDMIAYRGQEPVAIYTFPNELDGSREQEISILEPGMYCILHVVTDVAGNHKLARRFLLFDDVNGVDISLHDSEKMWAPSAAANTSDQWITTLDENMTVQWDGHFYNEFHMTHKLLNEIEPHDVPLATGYEERAGQPPITRSMEAIPNVNGIVHFHAAFMVDHQGGRSITDTPGLAAFSELSNIEEEEWSVSVPREDGDSVRVWVRAEDVMGNSAVDQILLHVDASPPVVEDIWINREGTEQLATHFSKDCLDLRFDLTSFDYHSGLHSLAWELHDTLDSSMVHGDGHLAVRTETSPAQCAPPTCYCIPKDDACYRSDYTIEIDFSKLTVPVGEHDYDYNLQITATNNAQLQTTIKFKVAYHQINGSCSMGCEDGHFGSSCLRTCPDCLSMCDENGRCIHGCKAGRTGDYCEQTLQASPQSVHIGMIAGGAVAVVVLVAILAGVLLVRRIRRGRGEDKTETENIYYNVREGIHPPREGRDLVDEDNYAVIRDSAISKLNVSPPSKLFTSGSLVNDESSSHGRTQDIPDNKEMASQQIPTTKPSIKAKPYTKRQIPSQTRAPDFPANAEYETLSLPDPPPTKPQPSSCTDVHANAEYEALNLPEPSSTKMTMQKIKHHIKTADLDTEHQALTTGTRNQVRSRPSHPAEPDVIESSNVNPTLCMRVVECSTIPTAENLAQFWSQINSDSVIVLLTDKKNAMDETDLHWLPTADDPILLPTGLEVHEMGREDDDGITYVTIRISTGSHEYANVGYDGNPDETFENKDMTVMVMDLTSPAGVVAAWKMLQNISHFTVCSVKRDQIDVFAVCMFLLDQSQAFDAVDIPAAIKQLREQHPTMISNVESYHFIYKVLAFFSEQGTVYSLKDLNNDTKLHAV